MKKYLLVLGVFSMIGITAKSQDSRFPNRGCGTMEEDAILRTAHPEMGTLDDFENWTSKAGFKKTELM